MKNIKKKSSDYGQFYFRIPLEVQPLLEEEIQTVLNLMKKKTSEEDLMPKRNELIVRALRRGLKSISRELK